MIGTLNVGLQSKLSQNRWEEQLFGKIHINDFLSDKCFLSLLTSESSCLVAVDFYKQIIKILWTIIRLCVCVCVC